MTMLTNRAPADSLNLRRCTIGMEGHDLGFRDAPIPAMEPDQSFQGEEQAPAGNQASSKYEHTLQDHHTLMYSGADPTGEQERNSATVIGSDSPSKPSQMTLAPISDNPLDAPEAPRKVEEDIDREDEEMAGTGDEPRDDNESPGKDGEGDAGSPQATDGNQVQSKSSIEATAREHLATQRFSVIIPSYSAWFDLNTIHQTEMKSVPEFFNSRNRSKTPAVYKDYRDFMINTYRLNPSEYLTVTACRRNLAGDVCAIMRVHAFLEQWGLINYQVDSDSRPSAIGPPFTGHFRVIADTPRGLQTFQPSPDIKKEQGNVYAPTENALIKAYKEADPKEQVELNLEIRRNFYDHKGRDLTADLKDKALANGEEGAVNGSAAADSEDRIIEAIAQEPKKPIYCSSCAIECTKGRFHCAKSVADKAKIQSIDVCAACFYDARISSSTKQVDFVWLEDTSADIAEKDAPWTDAELLLLLEALERFDENWNQIADYVGTRTREECVVKFLQLEIEDKYIEPDVSGPSYGALDQGRMPFSQSDNPVLSVLGYLASLSEPSVAAAAAGRSVEEMSKHMRRRLENGIGGSADDSTNKTSGLKANDSMDVDVASSPQVRDGKPVTPSADSQQQRDRDTMRDIANTTFATAAARAAALASNEEREMTRLVSAAVNTTLQKLELKLQQFSEMEALLQAERRELERERQQLFLDRLAFRRRVGETQEALQNAGLSVSGEVAAQGEREKLGFVKEGLGRGITVEAPTEGVNYEI
ncbi:MAG: hypothetical protein Q9163_003124 [Psora crenata]